MMCPLRQRASRGSGTQGRASAGTQNGTGASAAQRLSPHSSLRGSPPSLHVTSVLSTQWVSSQPASGCSSSLPQPAKIPKMPAMLIDSHAHLDLDAFEADFDAMLARARKALVTTIITIGTDLASSRRARDLAHAHPHIFASAGVHPHQADTFDDTDWPALRALWDDPRVCAVGETGLDYYYDYADRDRQQDLFRRHLQVAGEVNRPVVVHIRDAFDDAFAAVDDVGLPAGGVVHCFTGDQAAAERAIAQGFHISLSGIVTFKSARALRAAVRTIPDDRLLIETDAPFLAPVPKRGKRNEPSFVTYTAAEVARLRGVEVAHVIATTRMNATRLFGL